MADIILRGSHSPPSHLLLNCEISGAGELLKPDLDQLLVTHHATGAQGAFRTTLFQCPTFVLFESETSRFGGDNNTVCMGGCGCV